MSAPRTDQFDVAAFLARAGLGRKVICLKAGQSFFDQGTPAASVFYLQVGSAQLTVISKRGKEATIMLLKAGTSSEKSQWSVL